MKQYSCMGCDETITNPICPGCLESGVISWLHGRKTDMIPKVAAMGSIFTPSEPLTSKCILCKGGMNVCAHCYYEEIQRVLFRSNPDLAHEFSTFFNFELNQEYPDSEVKV